MWIFNYMYYLIIVISHYLFVLSFVGIGYGIFTYIFYVGTCIMHYAVYSTDKTN